MSPRKDPSKKSLGQKVLRKVLKKKIFHWKSKSLRKDPSKKSLKIFTRKSKSLRKDPSKKSP